MHWQHTLCCCWAQAACVGLGSFFIVLGDWCGQLPSLTLSGISQEESLSEALSGSGQPVDVCKEGFLGHTD